MTDPTERPPVERNANGRWANGNSGNPNGMRNAFPEWFRDRGPDALKHILNVMDDDGADPDLRLRCAEKIVERVYGKVKQSVEVDGSINAVLTELISAIATRKSDADG